MYPLIEIRTVPIELEIKTTHSKLEYVRGSADLEISRDKGGLSIRSRPIRLNVDTFEARNSIIPTPARSIQQNAQKGQQAAYQATAAYARQGQLLLKAKIGEELVTRFAAESQPYSKVSELGIEFLPSAAPEIDWDPGEMQIRYEMDKLNFDWQFNRSELKFIPGDVQISVSQMPDVEIKYVGGPLYVPPSADPSHDGDA
ncbi:MAG: hypothetical protein HFE86_03985 [Clostridiales bacterium]|nr:hypothetical protein [Clostridiales bacterium]